MPNKQNEGVAEATQALSHEDDWRKVCRICLGTKGKFLSLFNRFLNSTFSHYLSSLADIKISKGDQLPSNICKACVKDLKYVIKFQEKCQNSDKYLHNRLISDSDDGIASTSEIKYESAAKPSMPVKKEKSEDSIAHRVKQEPCFVEIDCDLIKEEDIKKEPEQKAKTEDVEAPVVKVSPRKKYNKRSYQGSHGVECTDCDKSFATPAKQRAHWYYAHRPKPAPKLFTCKICQRIFKSDYAFENHNKGEGCRDRFKGMRIESDGDKKMYCCDKCDYKKPKRCDVWRHYLTHTGEHPYHCNLCTKAYTSRKSLAYHKETVHKVYKVIITCHLCGKVVEGTNRFNRHLHATHPNSQYQCDYCQAFIKSKGGLVLHLKSHENRKEYICDTCGKAFNTAPEMRRHISYVHGTRKIFSCLQCPYKIKDRKSFNRHTLQHSQDKIQCAVCYKFVDNLIKLKKHMEYHGEKKHFCMYCNKGFVRKKDCTTHERVRHLKNWPMSQMLKQEPAPVSEDLNISQ